MMMVSIQVLLTALCIQSMVMVVVLMFFSQSTSVQCYEGELSSSWDCCKPSCAWSGTSPFITQSVETCEADGVTVQAYPDTASGCGGGGWPGKAFICNANQPWSVNHSLAFGFVKASLHHNNGEPQRDWCCTCYELKFSGPENKDKVMVVQAINSAGYNTHQANVSHFDLYVPGAGGAGSGCGHQYRNDAMNATTNPLDHRLRERDQCGEASLMPVSLQSGCRWRFDWLHSDNQTATDQTTTTTTKVTYRRVQCPESIISKTWCRRKDEEDLSADAKGYASL